MAASQTDRNLLFGVIALQLDILDPAQFAEACAVWALRMDRPMAELLEERGWITPDDRQEIARNLERKLRKHRGDVHASLASAADSSVREILRSVDQPAIRQSVDELAPATGHVLVTAIPAAGAEHASVRYTLSRVHGEGGLGRVWLARDTDLNRKVALKEIRLEKSADARYLRRFLKEAQVTGQLEHPNIVPVYELARRKQDDQPFYTMRFVEGRTLAREIADFHGERAGRPADRLALQRRLLEPFLKICEAIDYAHSRHVIHRDLKPENVVLGDHGEVIVLDWGLAKLLPEAGAPAEAVGDDAIAITADAQADKTQGRVGTPAYMAPEQVAMDNDQLDTRTDLYGLGAILFEILTNRPPAQGATVEEIYQVVSTGRIPRARQVDPAVPGPLDAICARTLSLNRDDRYPTAAALADDVRRWMIDEPVSVYRDPLTVRLARWGRKHRTQVATAAAVLIVTATAAALVASQQASYAKAIGRKNMDLARANAALVVQRRKAEQREQMAIDAVKRFGDAVSKNTALKNNPALELLRKELLKEPLSFFKTLRDQLQADRDTRVESLGRLASVAFDLAKLIDEIGDKQDALRAYEESLAIRKRLVQGNPTATVFANDLASSHHNIGNLEFDIGHPDEALASYSRALAIQERLVQENPTVTQFQRGLALNHNSIGLLQLQTGHPGQALASYRMAMTIQQRLARENPTVSEFQYDLAASHGNIGKLHRQTGHPGEALESYGKALAIQERLTRENPAVAAYQQDLAASYGNNANLQSRTGHPDEALESYSKALGILERLARQSPTVNELQRDLATNHNNLGILQRATGHPDQALESYGRALAIRERLARDNPGVTKFQSELAASHNSIGLLQSETGHPGEGLVSHGVALAIRERLAQENPTVTEFQQDLAESHNNLGSAQLVTGHADEAIASYGRAVEIFERLVREHPESPDFASGLGGSLHNIAAIELDQKRYGEARARLEGAIFWQRKALAAYPKQSSYRQFLALHLAGLFQAANGLNDPAAAAEAQRALDDLKASDPRFSALDARLAAVFKGEAPKDNAERLALAQRAYDTGRHAAAARLWDAALERDPNLGEDRQAQHRYNAACAAALAGCQQGRDDPKPDDAARCRLRNQARAWLEAELAVWVKLLDSANSAQRTVIAQTLQHWQADTDLAGVREPKAIDALPEPERDGWRELWKNVAKALARARGHNR